MSLQIESFELRAYGPFTGTVLDLRGAADGDLHLITGPNEAGKSTSRRGISDFMFGIPRSTGDNHLHANSELRLAATLVDAEGRRLTLVRRKGNTKTLSGKDNAVVDDGVLAALLGGMTREAFEAMFSITHESLVSGAEALLAADGELGESLFSASLGATRLHELRSSLQAQADGLFRPRASTSLVLQARSAYDAATARLGELTLRVTSFKDHERQVSKLDDERAALRTRITMLRAEDSARQRLCAVHPQVLRRQALKAELDSLAGVPQLSADATGRRTEAQLAESTNRRLAAEAQDRVDKLQRRVAAFHVDEDVIAHEERINALHGRLVNVAQGEEDLSRQQAKLQAATSLAEHALHALRPDLGLSDADELRLTEPLRAAINEAIEDHAALRAAITAAEEAVAEADDEAAEAARRLDELPEAPDTAALDAACAAARALGDIDRRIDDADADRAEAEGELRDALAGLSPAAGLDTLRAMRPPSAAAVSGFVAEAEELAGRDRDLQPELQRVDDARRQLAEDDDRLSTAGDVPALEDLRTARDERDGEWGTVLRLIAGDTSVSGSPARFEKHLRRADDVADQLRSEADAVARRADLDVRRRRLGRDAEALEERKAALHEARTEHELRWQEAWRDTGIRSAAPPVMSEWLRERDGVLERDRVAQRRRTAVQAQRHTRDTHLAALRRELLALGATVTAETLSAAVAQAEQLSADAAGARDARGELEDTARRAAAVRQRAAVEAKEDKLEAWRENWQRLIGAAGWPRDVTARGARQVLGRVDELFSHLRDVEQLANRVYGIQSRIDTFVEDAGELVRAVAPELASWPAANAIAELARRLGDAVDARGRRETLDGQLQEARDQVAAAEEAVSTARGELEGLLELAGTDDVADLPEIERRSQRATELRALIPELEADIRAAGQAPVDELDAHVAEADIDALRAESEQAAHTLSELEAQLAELDGRAGELRREREQMEAGGGAAAAAEDLEQQVSELRELSERYLVVHLAAWALTRAIDRYRREHKAPLLKRADELFPALTGGSFRALEVSFDEGDQPVLIGVRANGERLEVRQMSNGTREQLYLALRLASLERHVELHGRMPVVLDDVVLHSDRGRKRAILAAVGELARRTQVIAFTHDRDVVSLAREVVPADVLTVHELGGDEISGARRPQVPPADVRPLWPAKAA